jgi:PncC family amidohydrolase
MYDIELLNEIRDALTASGETLAVAESVTSGHLQAALSSAEFASKFFQGGITAYNLGQKCRHLNIDPIKGEACDCVSQEISIEMARQVCKLFTCNWGIGITGYATPMTEQNVQDPFAFFAIVHNGKTIVSRKIFDKQNETAKVQLYFVNTIIAALHDSAVGATATITP